MHLSVNDPYEEKMEPPDMESRALGLVYRYARRLQEVHLENIRQLLLEKSVYRIDGEEDEDEGKDEDEEEPEDKYAEPIGVTTQLMGVVARNNKTLKSVTWYKGWKVDAPLVMALATCLNLVELDLSDIHFLSSINERKRGIKVVEEAFAKKKWPCMKKLTYNVGMTRKNRDIYLVTMRKQHMLALTFLNGLPLAFLSVGTPVKSIHSKVAVVELASTLEELHLTVATPVITNDIPIDWMLLSRDLKRMWTDLPRLETLHLDVQVGANEGPPPNSDIWTFPVLKHLKLGYTEENWWPTLVAPNLESFRGSCSLNRLLQVMEISPKLHTVSIGIECNDDLGIVNDDDDDDADDDADRRRQTRWTKVQKQRFRDCIMNINGTSAKPRHFMLLANSLKVDSAFLPLMAKYWANTLRRLDIDVGESKGGYGTDKTRRRRKRKPR